MYKVLRFPALFALIALTALSTFAQPRPMVGTVIDVDEGRGRLQIEYDDDATRATIETDSVSTVYHGFGTVIAGKPEIFTGSSGLSNIRLGDRVEIRGTERGTGVWRADRVTLIGRNVEAGTTGVGTTRDRSSVSTAVDDRATGTATPARDSGGTVEGTIRSINEGEGRLVIVTTQRRMITVRTYRSTPVLYRGETYRVTNLEVGDRVRIEAEARGAQADEITARRITVVQSVQDSGTAPDAGGRVTTISGRVTRVESGLDRLYVDTGREEVRVDMAQAQDAEGDTLRARDVRVDDRVEITGSFNRVGDMFNASTLRITEGDRELPNDPGSTFERPALVTTGGAVTETLEDATTLGVRETDTNRIVRIWIAPDFVVKMKNNSYAAASTLREKDTVIIQAYRDSRGNLIAQTVRVRNR
ncbi:MAG TPA: DUF5666 domain-containing protein [Thermoanaerobaculia bacterium]|nr:DUF5666 domain-containing protein [Thermoanaerobaculia bacterium]